MTRFARKGKAQGVSHREPEEATPWAQMVATIKPRNFSVEDDEEFIQDDFEKPSGPEEDLSHDDDESSDEENGALVKIGLQHQQQEDEEEESESDAAEDPSADSDLNDLTAASLDDNSQPADFREEESEDANEHKNLKRKSEHLESEGEPESKKKKKRAQKCKVCGSKEHLKRFCEQLPEERRKELQELHVMKTERVGKGTGRKKNKANKNKLPYEKSEQNNNKENHKDAGDKEKSAKNKNNKKKEKNKKYKKEIRDRSGAIVEEGEVIFQGFRVLKEDRKRLMSLYKELKTKGLSKEELEAAIKRERRIAEKRLDRSKKLVCFKCRQPGHMLADCPQATDADKMRKAPDSGICFKCGSLEHKAKDCRSKAKGENAYNFAVCFICQEKGHLAKACPDNPRGLYPKGGGCKFCGSVEHLKRDCPRKIEKDMRSGVVAGTISGGDFDAATSGGGKFGGGIEEEPNHFAAVKKGPFVKKHKVVKF